MSKKMTSWGIGPKFTFLSISFSMLVTVIHIIYEPLFVIQGIPRVPLIVIGLVLVAIGIPIYIASAKTVRRGFAEDILVTQGVYALCRHPLYGSFIFFTIPGLLLVVFPSWLLFAIPLFMYIILKFLIVPEEKYLKEKFGETYLAYAKKVNAFFPQVWKVFAAMWYPLETGQVTENVYAVKVRDVNMFFYTEGGDTIAIDAAYPGDALQAELNRLPIGPASVTHLFLTHTDVDHTGGLDLFPNAQIYFSKEEEQMINGTTSRMLWFYHNPSITRPYTLLNDSEIVTVGSIKIRAVATPGHTPGSMSFLVNDRVLFAGDTLRLQNGHALPFYRLLNMNTAIQKRSIKKLARLEDVTLLCTGHTGCTQNYAFAMKRWK
jgi:hydroxyacylglutathione hydrolase